MFPMVVSGQGLGLLDIRYFGGSPSASNLLHVPCHGSTKKPAAGQQLVLQIPRALAKRVIARPWNGCGCFAWIVLIHNRGPFSGVRLAKWPIYLPPRASQGVSPTRPLIYPPYCGVASRADHVKFAPKYPFFQDSQEIFWSSLTTILWINILISRVIWSLRF